jgi:hypothetical protein
MTFMDVFAWVMVIIVIAVIGWFSVIMLMFLWHVVTRPIGNVRYPQHDDGSDEPDGSSYSVVRGEVRLD